MRHEDVEELGGLERFVIPAGAEPPKVDPALLAAFDEAAEAIDDDFALTGSQ